MGDVRVSDVRGVLPAFWLPLDRPPAPPGYTTASNTGSGRRTRTVLPRYYRHVASRIPSTLQQIGGGA